MHIEYRFPSVAVLIAVTAAVCSAQSIVSARSGTLHYFEGDVSIDGTASWRRQANSLRLKNRAFSAQAGPR